MPGDESSAEDASARGRGASKPTRSAHARKRANEGRPLFVAISDVQRAGLNDVFVQPRDECFVVRGPKGREYIFTPDGKKIVTALVRSRAAHLARLRPAIIRPATEEEFRKMKEAIGG